MYAEWINYGDNDEYRGYLAQPKKELRELPAVLVLQEIWGVDSHIREVTERIAAAGYLALAPDLFAENGKRPPAYSEERIEQAKSFLNTLPSSAWRDMEARNEALCKYPQTERNDIQETLQAILSGGDRSIYIPHLLKAASHLRKANSGRKVGVIGFCMGGGLSAMLAVHDRQINGAVVFYGNAPDDESIPRINCPILGIYAEKDPRITGQVPAFAEAMQRNGKNFEHHIYQDALHAFFNDTRPTYNAAASRDAFARTLAFFNRTLS